MRFRPLHLSPATASGLAGSSRSPALGRPRFAPPRVSRGFLGGVLDYVASDERLIADFASEVGLDPADVERGRAMLAGNPWERDVP